MNEQAEQRWTLIGDVSPDSGRYATIVLDGPQLEDEEQCEVVSASVHDAALIVLQELVESPWSFAALTKAQALLREAA